MAKFTFRALGGCNEVGRSSFLLDSGEKILLERGVKLNVNKAEHPLPVRTNLDAAVISHAHLDHSGYLPELFTDSSFLCYMTEPTLHLARMLWFDSLKIADAENIPAKWTKAEIRKIEKYTFPMNYKKRVDITMNVSLEFFDAGHILGSAMNKLCFPAGTLLYTGDFKVDETRLFNGADLKVGKVDFLVIESTYGDREHPPRKECEKEFVEAVQDTVDRGGHALVPAFAVGRSQEIIDVLNEYKLNVPIYFDGMGQKAAKISLQFSHYLKNPKFLKRALSKAFWVRNESTRKKALKQPSVIVTTAGMLQGGPVLNYLKKLYKDRNSMVLLTGYQVHGTSGRKLLDTNRIAIDGNSYVLKAKVQKFDFSAHASQREMLNAITKWSPRKIILVHGDKDVINVFKQTIESETGIETVAAELDQEVVLG